MNKYIRIWINFLENFKRTRTTNMQCLDSFWRKPDHYAITLIFKMRAEQISMGFIMCIIFLNFLADYFLQIINMQCECKCRLRYPRMMHYRDKVCRLLRLVTMHNFKCIPIDLFTDLWYANSAVDKIRSQFLKLAPTKHRKRFPGSYCWETFDSLD